jgi:dienelactone hydrolase
VPTTVTTAGRHPILKSLTVEAGGTPEANARAARDSWPRVVAFLNRELRHER